MLHEAVADEEGQLLKICLYLVACNATMVNLVAVALVCSRDWHVHSCFACPQPCVMAKSLRGKDTSFKHVVLQYVGMS